MCYEVMKDAFRHLQTIENNLKERRFFASIVRELSYCMSRVVLACFITASCRIL